MQKIVGQLSSLKIQSYLQYINYPKHSKAPQESPLLATLLHTTPSFSCKQYSSLTTAHIGYWPNL
jgi:hypothetical protein